MTETKNFKLKKPGQGDPVNIDDLNENFQTIDDHLGKTGSYIIDLTGIVRIDFTSNENQYLTVTDHVDANLLMQSKKSGNRIFLKIMRDSYDNPEITFPLDGYEEDPNPNGSYTFSFHGTFNHNNLDYSLFVLSINTETDGVTPSAAYLRYTANPMGKYVKTVNGVAPDGLGNVDIQEGREEPVHVDMAGFYDGTIRLEYEDGGIMAVAVTFDADGNPIRFSNGVEEITFTWPSEEAAADG